MVQRLLMRSGGVDGADGVAADGVSADGVAANDPCACRRPRAPASVRAGGTGGMVVTQGRQRLSYRHLGIGSPKPRATARDDSRLISL